MIWVWQLSSCTGALWPRPVLSRLSELNNDMSEIENMNQQYGRESGAGMLEPRHQTMSDVVLFATERVLAETAWSHDQLAGEVMRTYEDHVPPDVRVIDVYAPRVEQDHPTYSKRDRAAQTRLRRYREGAQPVPADMVMPWLAALPERYGRWGRETIAHQLGFMAAERPDAPGAQCDASLLTDISGGSSEAMRLIVQALADGRLDEDDAEMAPDLYVALGDLAAKAVAAQARICARTGYHPSEGRPVLTIVGGDEVSA